MKTIISGILGKTCPPSFTLMIMALKCGLHKFFPILKLFNVSWHLSGTLSPATAFVMDILATDRLYIPYEEEITQ